MNALKGLLLVRILHSCTLASVSCKYQREELTLSVLITKGILSHVCQLDRAFGARIHKPVAALGVELSSGDDLGQLLHVRWFYVDNVEALVLDVEVP